MASKLKAGDATKINLGPWAATFDVSDPTTSSPTRLFDSVNCYIADANNRSGVLQRHGQVGSVSRLVNGTNATGQGFVDMRTLSGSLYQFAFCGGRIWSYDGNVTFTDVTPTGIAIDPVNPIYTVVYNGLIIVSDENNTPWIFDPVAGTGTLIDSDGLATPWKSKGGPTIYGNRVFFILAARGAFLIATDPGAGSTITTESSVELTTEFSSGFQNTLIWCESLTPAIGYQQTNFSDNWTLTQTSDEWLTAIVGDEGIFCYFRQRGIGTATGAVGINFQGNATRDNVSTTIGTNAPAAVILVDHYVYFVDLDGRPYRFLTSTGAPPEPLWYPIRRQVQDEMGTANNRANVAANARVTYHDQYKLILWTIWDKQTVYAFDAVTGGYVGTMTFNGAVGSGCFIDSIGSLLDNQLRRMFVFLGTRASGTYNSTTQGVFWRQKFPNDTNQWMDEPTKGGAAVAMTRAIECGWIRSDAATAYSAKVMNANFVGDTAGHTVTLQYVTPQSGLSVGVTATTPAVTGEKDVTDSMARTQWGFGRNAQGSGLRFRWTTTDALNWRFGIYDGVIEATVTAVRPKAA